MSQCKAHANLSLICCLSIATVACAADDGDLQLDDRTEEIISNLTAAGFDEASISVQERPYRLDGMQISNVVYPSVILQGDVIVSQEASRAMIGTGDGSGFRLWRTPNAVDPDQAICMVPVRYLGPGAESWSWALVGSLAYQALSHAGGNYNAADMSLDFYMRSGTVSSSGTVSGNFSGCDAVIVVYSVYWLPGGVYGEGAMPSGDGKPGSYIHLSPDIEDILTADRKELVLTHEIGHTLGLRHSDWKTGSSCLPDSPEAQDGAVHIEGTVDQTEDSVMAACMPVFTDGELEPHDHAALEALWPE